MKTGATTQAPELAQTDDDLIARIASARDELAFGELCRRYERTAYNLALYLTGDRAMAEEAVQEAMLSLWLKAVQYKPGNARGWIMSITGNASCQLARSQSKRKRREQAHGEESAKSAAPSYEQDELLAGLRAALEALSQQDRTLVGLYYGSGLSQERIAEALEMPQSTVSYKLQQALDGLRQTMTRLGFAATVPVSAELFWQLCNTGPTAPAGLTERTLSLARCTAQASRRLAAHAPARHVYWLMAGTAATVLAAGSWFLLQPSAKSSAAQPATGNPSVRSAPAEDAGAFDRVWTFDRVPEDLTPIRGKWTWVPPKDGAQGLLQMEPAQGSVDLPLPVEILRRPFEVCMEIDERSLHPTFNFGVNWFDAKGPLNVQMHNAIIHTYLTKKTPLRTRAVFAGAYVFASLDGHLISILQAPSPYPTSRVGLGCSTRIALRSIRIRTLNSDEVKALPEDLDTAYQTFDTSKEVFLK